MNHAASQLMMRIAGVALGLLVSFHLPWRWCAREADAWWSGTASVQQPLAHGVADWLDAGLDLDDFTTGSSLFNGEWLFGTYLMAGLGFAQTAMEHPAWRAEHTDRLATCIDRILSDPVQAFDHNAWREDPIESLGPEGGDHAAYLGYFNLLLGLHRRLDPASPYADLHDRMTEALVRRVAAASHGMLQSYPGERYPVDNCAVVGSIGLHGRVTGVDHGDVLRRWEERCRAESVDAATGLLTQAVGPNGEAWDEPRGSGTALGVYFLSFGVPELSRDLYAALRRELATRVLGFGAVREYPRGTVGGMGDIDSGPVIFGLGFSATGFAIAGSRAHGDEDMYRRLVASAHLAGAPRDRDGRRSYVTGGPLGTAILLAMFTALPPERWEALP